MSIAFGSNHYLFMAIVYISDYLSLFYKQYNKDNLFQIWNRTKAFTGKHCVPFWRYKQSGKFKRKRLHANYTYQFFL